MFVIILWVDVARGRRYYLSGVCCYGFCLTDLVPCFGPRFKPTQAGAITHHNLKRKHMNHDNDNIPSEDKIPIIVKNAVKQMRQEHGKIFTQEIILERLLEMEQKLVDWKHYNILTAQRNT